MRRFFWEVLGFVVVVSGCSSSKSTPPGKTCSSGNLDCFLENLTLEEDGFPEDLTMVSTSSVSSSGGGGPGPSITNQPGSVTVAGNAGSPLAVDWTDPNACRPSFCIKFCAHGSCTSRSGCTGLVSDGLMSGKWGPTVSYTAEPASGSETFAMGITPLSTPDCDDPLDLLTMAPDMVSKGNDVSVGVQVNPGSGAGGNGGGSGGGSGAGCPSDAERARACGCGGGTTSCSACGGCDCPSTTTPGEKQGACTICRCK